jgi:hypothetical protein
MGTTQIPLTTVVRRLLSVHVLFLPRAIVFQCVRWEVVNRFPAKVSRLLDVMAI